MKSITAAALLVASALAILGHASGFKARQTSRVSAREEAYRANNLGVALLEQFKYKEAADAFRRALQIDSGLSIARLNVSIALFNEPNLDASLREARAAAETLPDSPQPHYIIALIAKAQNRTDDAIASLRRVLRIDPTDPGANINLGQLYAHQRKYVEAIPAFRTALTAEPYSVTASYNLAIALLRAGQREEGQKMMEQFQTLRNAGYGTTLGQNYLEQGRYAEAIFSTGNEPDLVNPATPDVTFVDATSSVLPVRPPDPKETRATSSLSRTTGLPDTHLIPSMSGGIVAFDYDGDGDADLFEVSDSAQRLYRNESGKLTDVTEQSGLERQDSLSTATGAVAGDYDNDGKPDLFVMRGRIFLYRNEGNGRFREATAGARIPDNKYLTLSLALVDVDHDGDLDLFSAGFVDLNKRVREPGETGLSRFPDDFAPAPNLLLRNNGDGTFTDITASAKLAGPNRALAVIPTDYNNGRDIDLLVLSHGEAPMLFSNQRDGTFQDVGAAVGLGDRGPYACAAAGDVNKDGYTDFFFGRADGQGLFAMSDGKGRFVTSRAEVGTEGALAAQFMDYDNDGLLDLIILTVDGMRVVRNIGGKWADVTSRAVRLSGLATGTQLACFDLEGDGDLDVVIGPGPLRIARNDGGNRNRSLKAVLTGKVSNKSGIGAKIELRAGSLWQKLESYATSPAPAPADLLFGLGQRGQVDAVRVLWPAGIVQAEISPPLGQAAAITELDRKPSSCPFLYTWNGERFEFITDFMGGGEMGYAIAPRVWNYPDPDEYVRITEDRMKPRDGFYEVRVTNELEEVLYVDRLQLIAISHPAGTEIYPNEGMANPRKPYKLFVTRGAKPPVAAIDDHGCDVLRQLTNVDRRYPDDFKLLPNRGYAEEHGLTLDLGAIGRGRTLLLLNGWTDYAFSSDNVAAHQGGLSLSPPSLQARNREGNWTTVIADIGIPVGRPQTVVVDLTGKLPPGVGEVRIVTNMRIYWDQILVDTSNAKVPIPVTRLDPTRAELRWRGFSAEVTPDGLEPYSYDYQCVTHTSPWKTMPGRYTREGDVRELLRRTDDTFVIARPGDEIALKFDSRAIPHLKPGWKHTFLLYSDGFSKEMDINSATPDHVLPLPFHGMKRYPYGPPEAYPMTSARRQYLRRYNTRVVHSPIESLDAMLGRSRSTRWRDGGDQK